ncbi:hypothetical protein [Gordonia sp. (in: high G+C Gram-positive bacteria)]|uniref:hypothetical protein n=1 Tax=Gordonia sp. (in: high G+C Gram-positive bacteria) TaxID=84139 RepID=UPI002623492C|nr:hypothetical protein [Gordonia sp. (in: high G+C Gram-positive bacteria)]
MSLTSLAAAPPTGRGRPLIIDDTDYATAVIRQGSTPPWTDVAALAGHFGQVHSLLNADATWIDVQRWQRAHLQIRRELVAGMAERSRTGYALRALLGAPDLVEEFVLAAGTVAQTTRRNLVLRVPSPAAWLAWAHAVAGTSPDEIDADDADGASMYIAEWLGQLGALPVDAVVLDATGAPEGLVESLSEYTAITNVAAHFDWSVLLRHPDRVEVGTGVTVGVLPAGFWCDGAEMPEGDVVLTTIPAEANPETVLDKLKQMV